MSKIKQVTAAILNVALSLHRKAITRHAKSYHYRALEAATAAKSQEQVVQFEQKHAEVLRSAAVEAAVRADAEQFAARAELASIPERYDGKGVAPQGTRIQVIDKR